MFSQQLKRLAGPGLIVGGLLWVATTIASIIVGMLTGKVTPFPDAHSPALVYIGMWLFPFAILPLGIGLLGLFARLEGHARGLGITGVVLTGMGVILGIGALMVLSTIFGTSNLLDSLFGGFGSFATIIGSGFLGWAALRARTLPLWVALILLIMGFVTVPFIFVTPLPVGPPWATDFLGFLLIAIVYVVVGVTLVTAHEQADETSRGVSVPTAVEVK